MGARFDETPAAATTLSHARQRLLALRRSQRSALQPDASESVAPRPQGGPADCSFAQEALWIIERLNGDSGAYNIAQAVRIDGALQVEALGQALQALTQRHEALRTSIDEQGGVPVQVVHASKATSISLIDARQLGVGADEARLLQRLGEEAQRSFDLTHAPLLRAGLWELGERQGKPAWVLLLVVHHIVADGWSMQVIARELSALYSAFSTGARPLDPAMQPPLQVQFADWAWWQRQRMRGDRLTAALHYWRRQLAGIVPLELPVDLKRPQQLSQAGRSVRFTLPRVLLERLRGLAREHHATLFMLLLAVFKVVLMRHARQDDVAVGTPVAGRDRPELEDLVGYFVNTVVLRTDLSGDPPFSELLARVRETALEGFTHQDLPFEKLVATLSPQRDLSRNPLYQVAFALNNQPAPVYALAGVSARILPLQLEIARFDLSLTFVDADTELQGHIAYSTDLFEHGRIERLASHLQTALAGIAADPGQRLSQVPLLGEAERKCVLEDWNRSAQPDPNPRAVHVLVAQQAERTPAAVAVECGSERLSYGELNLQANRLAQHLRGLGVGPDVPVGVCMERSLQLVVALLGVLKAGGAFLPLDPELPAERLDFQLRDTASPVVLTQAGLRSRLRDADPTQPRHVLCLDADSDLLTAGDGQAPTCVADPEQLAYVIYTSGSTGKPKGVQIPHRGLSNQVHFMQAALGLTPRDRLLQKTPMGFDASVWEFFAPLHAGATLVMAAPGGHRDTAYLARTVRERGITVLQLVPSVLRVLADEPAFADCAGLRHLLLGGETLTPDLVCRVQRQLPWVTLGNLYGPTEVSCNSHHFELPAGWPEAKAVPIGTPIANTQSFILDAHLQPTPIGVVGELYLGGVGLARGYLNRPELTAERFVPHPFRPGQRLYRSGDLVRFRADGQIEFLGRTDLQLKIRGQRIEPGEIEAVLHAQAGVRSAVVLAREDEPGQMRLVAYVVVSAPHDDIDRAALRSAMARQLPETMLPSAFVVLPRLPLLPNGKIDRQALPAPQDACAAAAVVAPRTPAEASVWQVWREVLSSADFGVRDNFFELGGHSLAAMQVCARLRAAMGVDLPLRMVFNHPTIEALAPEVTRAQRADNGRPIDAAPVIPRVSRDGPLAVSYSQRRMWLVQALTPQSSAYNMSFALRLRGPLKAAALTRAIDAVVQRHEAFRTRFALIDGEVMQFIDPPRPADVAQIDLRQLPADQREREAQRQRDELAAQPFDLSASGLFRIRLLQLGDDEHVLLWIIHHAIGDHWSDGILLREMGQVYGALLQGKVPVLPLPLLRVEYADYAAWQRAADQVAALAPHVAFWRDRLHGLEPLSLPHDRVRRGLPTGQGSSVALRLQATTVEAVKRLSTQHGATSFMFMLACFKLTLARCSGQTDVAVGSPVANRTLLESESLVGTFVNTLVLRTDLSGNPRFTEVLARVKATALDAFAHQDLPFERVVEELRVDRDPARLPIVQILFNVINSTFDTQALPGLRSTPWAHEATAAQFDLSLSVDEALGEVKLAYSTDLFLRATAERLLASLVDLVEKASRDPLRRVDDYTLPGAAGQMTLAASMRTDTPFRREQSLRLVRREEQSTAPLSLQQQRVWFMEAINPGRAVYHIRAAFRLLGKLDAPAFERAVNALIERQDALRTVFRTDSVGDAMQHVLPELSVSLLPAEELAGSPEEAKEDRLMRRLTALSREPFDLGLGPLIRMHMIRVSEEEHVFFSMFHHLIFDGWSILLLGQELAELYDACSKGRPAQLPALPVTYGDYAAWHREWMQGEQLASQLDFWLAKLESAAEPLALPADRPRPARQSGRVGTVSWSLAEDLIAALRKLAGAHQATLFTALLAGYCVFLHRHTGQQEFVIGVPVLGRRNEAGRRDDRLANVMGFFANTLPLRMSVRAGDSFTDVMRNARTGLLAAFQHADVPFERVVRELKLPRDESRFPVYQSFFSFRDFREARSGWGDLRVEPIAIPAVGIEEDLTVQLVEEAQGATGSLRYNADIFEQETADRFVQHYTNVLRVSVSAPDVAIDGLARLLDAEALQLATWNATRAPVERDACIHRLFERQARLTPDSVALVHGVSALSYRELERRASRLARHLRLRGVGRGALVGLCLERSADMVVAQLAILQAGAAYVPLDPNYPADRLTYMAQDAGLALLVSESTLSSALPWPRGQCVLLDAEAPAIAAQSDAPLAPDAALDARAGDPGYVIYTSGSTGKPKGVMVPQRAVVNFLTSMAREPGLRAADRLVAVTTLSFDIAVLELLLPLSVGAQVVLASREQALDGSALRQLLESSRASVMQATPSTWRMLVEAGWSGPDGFKALIGGEGLPPDLAQQLLDRIGSGGELWNLYGPTETTVWSTCWKVHDPERGISIGRPIANTQVHILDERQQLCPIGVPGEIFIGGEGVTLGYLHRPELTAERFIADPFGQDPGTRLYRTGDRGRWRHDGLLEHLGRLDHQVKLRGHRIELGEIEATLASHPEVARAVAVVREDRPGDARLVAYIVARDAQPAATALIEHLRHTLPDYMLPQHVVPLQAVPLLPNGKIDRKALPAPDLSTPRGAVEPAGSPIEVALLRIWCEQLGTTTIGVHDDFFALGGHSLLAAHLVHRISGELQVPCTLPMLFRAPTIRGLAQEIAKGQPTRGAELLALQPKGSGPALFCICGVHLYQALADHLGPNVPVYGIFLPYEQALIERAAHGHARLPSVEEMAADYVKTMRAQQPSGPYCLAGVSFGGMLAYEMAQQLTRSGEQVQFLAMLDTLLPGAIKRDWLHWTFDQFRQVRQQGSRVLAEKLRRRFRRGHDNSLAPTQPRPDSIEDELQHIIVARRAIYKQATRAYAVQPYAGHAILVRAQVGHWLSCDIADPSYRWSQFVQDLQIYDVPGDHLGILKPPNVHALARHLLPHIESGRLHRPAERGGHVAP